jgi:hypothetical protein
MINFEFASFWLGLEYLHQQIRQTQFVVSAGHGDDKVDLAQRSIIKNNISLSMRECGVRLCADATNQACLEIESLFNRYETWGFTL